MGIPVKQVRYVLAIILSILGLHNHAFACESAESISVSPPILDVKAQQDQKILAQNLQLLKIAQASIDKFVTPYFYTDLLTAYEEIQGLNWNILGKEDITSRTNLYDL